MARAVGVSGAIGAAPRTHGRSALRLEALLVERARLLAVGGDAGDAEGQVLDHEEVDVLLGQGDGGVNLVGGEEDQRLAE